jgi:hypothetical protein
MLERTRPTQLNQWLVWTDMTRVTSMIYLVSSSIDEGFGRWWSCKKCKHRPGQMDGGATVILAM